MNIFLRLLLLLLLLRRLFLLLSFSVSVDVGMITSSAFLASCEEKYARRHVVTRFPCRRLGGFWGFQHQSPELLIVALIKDGVMDILTESGKDCVTVERRLPQSPGAS